MEKELLKVKEAADALSISERRVWELIEKGQILSVKIGRVRRIPVAALNEFVDRLTAEATPLPKPAEPRFGAAGDGPTAA